MVQTEWHEDPVQVTPAKDRPIPKKAVQLPSAASVSSIFSEPPPPVPPVKKFVIQVGAFVSKQNAENYVKKLKSKGYQPTIFVQTIRKRKWNTVRIGSYENRHHAIQAAERISKKEKIEVAIISDNLVQKVIKNRKKSSPKKVKLKTTKVTPVPKKAKGTSTKTTKKAPKKDTGPKLYSFQVGGLLSNKVALAQKKKLQKEGYAAFILKVPNAADNEIWSTVQVGYFNSMQSAAQAASDFTNEEKIQAQARHIYNAAKSY